MTQVPAVQGLTAYAGWASTANDMWIVGRGDKPAAHWDGARWTSYDVPDFALSNVWGRDASHVYAFGTTGDIFTFDAGAWSKMPVSVGINTGIVFHDAWGIGGDVYAVGVRDGLNEGIVVKLNGDTWETHSAGAQPMLYAVWGVAANDVWAAGSGVAHFDGNDWKPATIPAIGNASLDAICGTSANDVWFVGSNRTVLHFDGAFHEITFSDSVPESAHFHRCVARGGALFISGDVSDQSSEGIVLRGAANAFEREVHVDLDPKDGDAASVSVFAVGNGVYAVDQTGAVRVRGE